LGQASRSIGLAQASAEGEADEPGDREGDERPDVVARRSPVLVVGRDDHGGCLHHTPAGDRRPAIRTQLPSATKNAGMLLLTKPPSANELETTTTAAATGAAIGNRRRKKRTPMKPTAIRASSHGGPCAPFAGSGPRTAIDNRPPRAASSRASTQ